MKFNLMSGLVACCLIMSGCSGNVRMAPEPPQAKLTNLAVSGMSFSQADLLLTFNVENKNFFDLGIAGLRYKVNINDVSAVTGDVEKDVTLAAKSSTELELPLSLVFSDLMQLVSNLGEKNTFKYDIETEIDVAAPLLGVLTVPVSASGEMPLPQLPRINNPQLSVDKLTLAGAKLNLAFDVVNPNAFNLLLNELEYKLLVGGNKWANMKTESETSLTQDRTTRIRLPVVVDFAAMGQSGFSLLQQDGSFAFDLDGNMNILPEWPGFSAHDLPFNLGGF